MATDTINVNGMTCNHCKMRVETAITALSGVSTAEVNLTQRNVAVRYDENVLSIADIKQAVVNAGYEPG